MLPGQYTFNSRVSSSSPSANKVEICQVMIVIWTVPIPLGLANPQSVSLILLQFDTGQISMSL